MADAIKQGVEAAKDKVSGKCIRFFNHKQYINISRSCIGS